jgi:hypothetical protein
MFKAYPVIGYWQATNSNPVGPIMCGISAAKCLSAVGSVALALLAGSEHAPDQPLISLFDHRHQVSVVALLSDCLQRRRIDSAIVRDALEQSADALDACIVA